MSQGLIFGGISLLFFLLAWRVERKGRHSEARRSPGDS
jgi:hypothetical protein